MWHNVLIAESQPGALVTGLEDALEAVDLAVKRRCAWPSLNPDHLAACRENLIVVNGVPRTEEGMRLFAWLHDHPLPVPTFAVLPPDDAEFVKTAARAVDDFLFWPVHQEELRHRILRLLGPRSETPEEVRRALVDQVGIEKFVGAAPAFVQALSRVALFGASEASVLLTGETGTGKELCARVIHMLSRRRNGPFIPVECSGLPDHLFENEVFGHVRGAFTDAHAEQQGLVSLASNGTLFLDEIDSLPPPAQGKLLRLIQEQTFRPLGSGQFRNANVRVIAASNCDLPSLIAQKRFRADLFFRLDVLRVHLPPLRERVSDIALLARHFIAETSARDGTPRKTLGPAAIRKLESYGWPGNVRELFNAIHRAVLCSTGTEILPMHIDLQHGAAVPADGEDRLGDSPAAGDFRTGKQRAIRQFERDYVERLLEKHSGNITRAATDAGKDRRAFGRLVKKYGLHAS